MGSIFARLYVGIMTETYGRVRIIDYRRPSLLATQRSCARAFCRVCPGDTKSPGSLLASHSCATWRKNETNVKPYRPPTHSAREALSGFGYPRQRMSAQELQRVASR